MLRQLDTDGLKDRGVYFVDVGIVWHANAVREAIGLRAYFQDRIPFLLRRILACLVDEGDNFVVDPTVLLCVSDGLRLSSIPVLGHIFHAGSLDNAQRAAEILGTNGSRYRKEYEYDGRKGQGLEFHDR